MTNPIFTPIIQEKLSVKIANQIKALIVDGELKPGDPLPPERELMGLLDVSRPSIREALKSLVGMGFLEASKGNRTVVKSLVSGKIAEPLHQLLREDITIIFHLLEVRKVIEAWNAYYAAKRATLADIVHLEACIASMKKKLTEDGSTLGKEDADFHLAISEATHNKVQTHIMFTIYDILKNSIGQYYENFDQYKIYQQHLEVVDAIKDKNSEAARFKILEHLDYVESRVKMAVNTADYTLN
jgi:GntR family transcriptional regulator, transcriptional repressor for pyruvate dehydrogenase complex